MSYQGIEDFVLNVTDFALAYGCFDILHVGHVRFFQQIKKQTELPLCVGVLPDYVVSLRKGVNRPIICEEQRVEVISAFRNVDFAFVLEQSDRIISLKDEYNLDDREIPLWSTALSWLDILRPREFYYSSDFIMTEKIRQFFVDRNIHKYVVPYTKDISTSKILRCMSSIR